MNGVALKEYGWFRKFLHSLAVALTVALASAIAPQAKADNGRPIHKLVAQTREFKTTVDYVTTFYPLWFTYYQSVYGRPNILAGPDRVTPIYQIVVAINVDTLYASGFIDVTDEPVVLTVPATTAKYSVLLLDGYGNIFSTGISETGPGVYALIGPGFAGKLPKTLTPISLPYNHMVLIFRADKYSSTGESTKTEAETFRENLLLQTLKDWKQNPAGGAASILPEKFFAAPFKTVADSLIEADPITFLKMLQTAVAAPNTPPLSDQEQALSDRFNSLFAKDGGKFQFAEGAQAAHQLLLENWLTHTGNTNWVFFNNIGHWGKRVLDRASLTEFIQYGNALATAAYYHAFKDANGNALDGSNGTVYVVKFAKKKIPEAARFWSLTAYTPESVELVRNDEHKYHVASYTRGLKYGEDGSVSIYMATKQPAGVPLANWLPIPAGPFNVMLRVYGPEGNVADGTYVPPGIHKR